MYAVREASFCHGNVLVQFSLIGFNKIGLTSSLADRTCSQVLIPTANWIAEKLEKIMSARMMELCRHGVTFTARMLSPVFGWLSFNIAYFHEAYLKDMVTALQYYHASAERENSAAMCNLGVFYENGLTCPVNVEMEFYDENAPQKKVLKIVTVEKELIEKDQIKAVEWYKRAAALDNYVAQCNLGMCYYHGVGVTRDYEKAVELYSLAAGYGYDRALNNMGACYRIGSGVEKNEVEAVHFYERAAKLGHAGAQYNLGLCYQNGRGVAKDFNMALYWYKKAADQHLEIAVKHCALILENGIGCKADKNLAAKYYSILAKRQS
eukprot:Nk52_evm13s62 gene=Nk52_evmTU13s62